MSRLTRADGWPTRVLDLAFSVGHALARIPSMRMSGHSEPRQLALALDETPLWNAATLEGALVHESGQALRLTLTDNRSVLVSFSRRAGRIRVRLHRMFLHAPADVVAGLARAVRRRGRVTDSIVRRFTRA